jgi:hypothetical protein
VTGKSRLEVLTEELRRFPADHSARMRFFNAFCDAEVFLLLNEEPDEGSLSPVVLDAEGRGHVLAFASEEHLADYSAQVAPYAALSGRVIVDMLTQAELAIAFNWGVLVSEMVITAEEITWLNGVISEAPETHNARPTSFFALGQERDTLSRVLVEKLISASELAQAFWLIGVGYETGAKGVMLCIVDAPLEAEAPLAKAALEAIAFCGYENLLFDVSFLKHHEKAVEAIERQGQRLVFPKRPPVTPKQRSMPGSDPARPPKLR